ncbi:ABC transporter permease [Paenibacillus lemnae]|uniref:ABC transporter n=1 Tax=Paenibacillus lemnae TaxID=1330551 RepID=A0A848M840_PAELE|nr:ABC transporter permease [Paenibacillus lemnae]NMO97378.1 ABC transporter [Paenibacillus lemnae]
MKNSKPRSSSHIRKPSQLFRRRLFTYWKQQLAAVRSVADWTVMLYILVPGLLLGGGIYRELWTMPLPAWLEWLPPQTAAAVLLFIYSGSIVLFVEEADALFLRQQPRWMQLLRRRGMLYSLSAAVVTGTCITLLLLPVLLRGFHLSGLQLAGWVLLAVGIGWNASLLTHTVKVRFAGIRKIILSGLVRSLSLIMLLVILAVLGTHPAALLTAGGLLLAVSNVLVRRKEIEHHTFTNDVREDAKVRVQLTEFVLKQAVGKPPRVRSKAWLFSKSRRIYRRNTPDRRFASAGVKAFLRQPESLLLYVQISAVGIPAVLFPPGIIKIIVYAGIMLLIAYMLHLRWKAFSESDFSKIMPFTMDQEMKAGTLAVQTLMIPPGVLLSLTLGFTLAPGWMGWLYGAGAAAASVYIFPPFFARPSLGRRDE